MDDDTKHFLASKTIWGAVVAAMAGVLLIMGHPISLTDQTTLINDLTELGVIVGSLLAIYGRITATKKIG